MKNIIIIAIKTIPILNYISIYQDAFCNCLIRSAHITSSLSVNAINLSNYSIMMVSHLIIIIDFICKN